MNGIVFRYRSNIEPHIRNGIVSIPLRDVDPIYALTNDRELYRDPEFRQRHIVYAEELMTIEHLLRERRELKSELRMPLH